MYRPHSMNEPGWYLARTKPMSEYVAAHSLARRGYRLFLPLVRTPRPRPGRDNAPLFPGYIFVHRDIEETLPPIGQMAGFIGWVEFDGSLPSLSHKAVEQLRERVRDIDDVGGHWERYKPGQQVRLVSGEIESLAEILEEPKSPNFPVQVLMSFMGRRVPARVPWKQIQPLNMAADNLPLSRRTRGRGRWIKGFGPRVGTVTTP